MLKKTVEFLNFNDQKDTETLYFNIMKSELADIGPILIPELEKFREMTIDQDQERDLTMDEIKQLLDVIKLLMRYSYGERSEDGKRFDKSPGVYERFQQTAAYDAFLMGLFENAGAGAFEFIMGILPKDLTEGTELAATTANLPVVEDTRPIWIKEDREPTKKELDGMTPDQLREAFRRRSQKATDE